MASTPTGTDEALAKAHKELESIMAANSFDILRKGADALAKFKAAAGKATGNTTSDEMEDEENREAAPAISAARARSGAGGKASIKTENDGDQYAGASEDADEDSEGDYDQAAEEDEDRGEQQRGTDMRPTRKSFSRPPSTTDVYDQLIKSDPTGDTVSEIDATPALEHMTSSFAKSLGQMGRALTDQDARATGRITRLEKSLARITAQQDQIASALGLVAEHLATQAAAPMAKSQATDARAAQEPSLEEQMVAQMNVPSFFGPALTGGTLGKSQAAGGAATLDAAFEGRETVAAALRKGMETGQLSTEQGGNLLADLDFQMPSQVASRVPAHLRAALGLPA